MLNTPIFVKKTWTQLQKQKSEWYEKNGYDFLVEMVERLETELRSVNRIKDSYKKVLLQIADTSMDRDDDEARQAEFRRGDVRDAQYILDRT